MKTSIMMWMRKTGLIKHRSAVKNTPADNNGDNQHIQITRSSVNITKHATKSHNTNSKTNSKTKANSKNKRKYKDSYAA